MLRDQLRELLAPVVAGLGYQLWELEYQPRSGGGLLRLYIDAAADSSERGITLDDCERVSHVVSETLDAADPIPGQYTRASIPSCAPACRLSSAAENDICDQIGRSLSTSARTSP